jgi:hypothetical protein
MIPRLFGNMGFPGCNWRSYLTAEARSKRPRAKSGFYTALQGGDSQEVRVKRARK